MAKLLLFLIVAVSSQAQALPKNWIGCGIGYSSTLSGWCSIAAQISSQGLYSYTTYDVQRAKGSVPITSVRTGFALELRHFQISKSWDFYILGLATGGTSETSSAITGSFSGGGLAVVKHGGWTLPVGIRQSSGASQGKVVEAAIGFSW